MTLDVERVRHVGDPAARACELNVYTGEPGTCRWCAGALPRTKDGRVHARWRWCSDACARRWTREHHFSVARSAAIDRDGGACVWCGATERDRPDAEPRDHGTGYSIALPDGRSWLEVDHVDPAQGRHGTRDCVHHVDNLRTLCRPCHRQRTREQRARAEGVPS